MWKGEPSPMITPTDALNNLDPTRLLDCQLLGWQSAWFISWVILPAGYSLKRAVLSPGAIQQTHVTSPRIASKFDSIFQII